MGIPYNLEYWRESLSYLGTFHKEVVFLQYLNNSKFKEKLELKYSQREFEDLIAFGERVKAYNKRAEVSEQEIEDYMRILEINPNFWDLNVHVGRLLFYSENEKESLKYFKQSLLYRPERYETHYNIAYIYHYDNKQEEALGHIEYLIKNGKGTIDVLNLKSFALYGLKRYEEVAKVLDALIDSVPNSIDFHNRRFLVLLYIGDVEGAFLSCKQFTKLDPKGSYESGALYQFSTANRKQKEAIAFLDSLIKVKPSIEFWSLMKLQFYSFSKQPKEVFSIYDALIRVDSLSYKYYYKKGRIIYDTPRDKRTVDRAAANKAFKKVVELNPDLFDGYEYMCRLNMWGNSKVSKEYKKKAIQHYYNKVKEGSKNCFDYHNLAKSYDLPKNGYGANNQYYDSMIKYYYIAIEMGCDSSMVIGKRAYELSKNKMFARALIDWQYNLKRARNSRYISLCMYNIAAAHTGLKEYDKAIATYEEIKRKFPEDSTAKNWIKDVKALRIKEQ